MSHSRQNRSRRARIAARNHRRPVTARVARHPGQRHQRTTLVLVAAALGLALCLNLLAGRPASAAPACPEGFDTEFRMLRSEDTLNLCQAFSGRPMLIINTASSCGFTPQFKGLEALYQEYKDKGLVVVGFPSGDFRQEARTEEGTAEVCYAKYGVTFPMLAPSPVKGANANPIFAELARQTDAPGWNFNKYLVDKDGNVVEHFGSFVGPQSDKLREAIDRVL